MESETFPEDGVAAALQAVSAQTAHWPGLDADFHDRAHAEATTEEGGRFRESLAVELTRLRGKASPIGLPGLVLREQGAELRRFVGAYHRAIETIVRAWRGHEELRRVVTLLPELERIVDSSPEPLTGRIHLSRVDLLPQPEGGLRVIETNANCPGALLTCSVASERWRAHLQGCGVKVPAPLEYEAEDWMAAWLVRTAEAETGVAPDFFVLLRERGGNRLEIPGLAMQLQRLGVGAVEADPRELTCSRSGRVSLRGRPVRHAYWKVGIREFLAMRPELDAFVGAMQRRELFVQNGFGERFIADNKLCLAALGDPRFDALFDPVDRELIRRYVPWSRNVSLCTPTDLERIRGLRSDYVLKRPLDTRGRGVVIGREVGSDDEWREAVDQAGREGWLAQEFCGTTKLESHQAGVPPWVHDLSVGVIEGRLAGALMRSSKELRTNVALAGRLHPVFMEA